MTSKKSLCVFWSKLHLTPHFSKQLGPEFIFQKQLNFCKMKKLLLSLSILLSLCFTNYAQQQLDLHCGQIVGTCFSGFDASWNFDPNGHVMGVMDVRDKSSAPLGSNWIPAMQSLPNWDANRMGQIFGLAVDNNYNIFVTATKVYGNYPFGSAGGGGIYKIDASTGAVSDFVTTGSGAMQIPNSGVGLGNIAYDKDTDNFFVTNLEDGKIYRVSPSGVVSSLFDPFVADSGSPGFAPLGERIWGIAVFNSRIYFSVWTEDMGRPSTPNQNRIYSVGIDGSGNFLPGVTCEIIMPDHSSNYSNPVSDIAFSTDGKMLVAERTMLNDMQTSAHQSRIFEFEANSPAFPTHCNPIWSAGKQIHIGQLANGENSAGGIDYNYQDYDPSLDSLVGCDSLIWGSGDALTFGAGNFCYGFAGMPSAGNTFGGGPTGNMTTSFYVDADGNLADQAKTMIGDVEAFKCDCAKPCTKNPDTKTFSAIIDSDNSNSSQNDRGFSGIQDQQTDEYLICGDSYAFFNQDVFVNVLDNIGNASASMICHRGDREEGARWMNEAVVPSNQLPGGGYFYTGSTGKYPERDLFFKATDKMGNLVSATIYDPQNRGDEIGHNVIQNQQGGFVAVGQRTNQNGQLSAYAVGLDPAMNTTWVNEYNLDGFAWSVVEIPYQISPAIDVVYAVTGMSRERVFVMLINGSDGTIVPWMPVLTYDLDFNPGTNEVGHSIEVDPNGALVVTGSANKNNLGQGIEENQLFILRIPAANIMPGSGTMGMLDLMVFYDIPSSKNEIARHIITHDDQYTVTGRAYSQIDPQTQGETGEAFMMTVRNNGALLWINDYTDPNYVGTKGERVERTKDGGYYMTGSIWQEQIPGVINQSYNKFAVKTDQMGKLNDCDCCAPNEVNIKDTQWQFEPRQIEVREEPIPEFAEFQIQEVPIKESFCDQYCPPEPCDIVTTHTIDTTIDTCCVVSLDLVNTSGGVYFINVEVMSPVTFDVGTINPAFPLQIVGGSTNANNIYIESNPAGNPIPLGVLNDYVTFCYEGVSTSQLLLITYYDQFGNLIPDCRDFIQTECEVEDNPDDCVMVMIDSIKCDSIYENKFKMYFRVTNKSPGQTMGEINFTALNPAILLPPNHNITPSIGYNVTSTTQCIDIVSPGPFPTDVFLTYTMTDVTNSFCCSNQDTLQIELPNCCSPCDEPQDQWVHVSQTSTNGDSCCHSLDIFNPCDFTLTKIQTEIVTPGVTFSSASVGGGFGGSWTVSGGSLIKDYIPNTIPAPSGNYNDLIEFCLDNPTNAIPQEVLVHYYISDGMGGDSILCTERLFFECEPNDEECLDVVHHTVFCDKETGRYYLDFWVENVSPGFIADRLEVTVAAPYNLQYNVTPSIFNPITLNPGDTYCDVVEIIGFPTPAAGDYLEVEFQIHKNQPYDCCEEKEKIGFTLPECCEDDAQGACCDDLAVDKKRIQGCCFETELTNFYSSNVQQVLACILTPNRQFTGVVPQGSYNTVAGPTTINVTHPGQIPFGTSTAYDFCIQNTGPVIPWWGYSTVIEYKWIETINNQSVIVCQDTVRYRCGGLIDIQLDPAICMDDVIQVSDLGDACVNVSTLPDEGNDRKVGVVIDIQNPDVQITDVVSNGPANWADPVVEDGMIFIDFNQQGPPNDQITSIIDICFSEIPEDGIDLNVHWIEADNAGNLSQCMVGNVVYDCVDEGDVNGPSIETGVYHFDELLFSNGTIIPNQDVKFKAGSAVQLDEGFEIKSNSLLEIDIEDCLNVIEN